jgi:hypothetical protein
MFIFYAFSILFGHLTNEIYSSKYGQRLGSVNKIKIVCSLNLKQSACVCTVER